MSPYSETILTNMVMIYDEKGRFLVQNRLKQDWPGLNFPGGHVERNESLYESAIREMKEETGLSVSELEQVGVFEWNVPEKNLRHVAILYRSKVYSGKLVSSKEGPMFWITKNEVSSYPLSTDFDKILLIMRKGLD